MKKKPRKIGKREQKGISFWFSCLKELGETIDIRFDRRWISSGKTDTFHRSHGEFDGIGAFLDILGKEGYPGAVPPALNEQWKRPGFAGRTAALWRAVTYPIDWEVKWRKRRAPSGDNIFATEFFSREETSRIREAARREGCGMTAFLLLPLNRIVCSELIHPDESPQLWQVPVNLRTGEERSNYSSYIAVELSRDDSTETLSRKFEHRLRKNIHWGVWGMAALVGRWLSPLARKWVRRHYNKKNPPFVGSFANIGNWVVPGKEDEAWALSSLVTRIRPFGAAAMNFNGRLSLSLLAHSTLEERTPEVERWLALWKSRVIDFAEKTP